MAGQIACQQRMADIPSAKDVAPQAHRGQGLAGSFETMSRRYAAMDMNGCTDDQRTEIPILVRHTHEIASLVARLPKAEADRTPALADQALFRQFESDIQSFENRRVAMQRDLDRMRAVRLR